MRLADDVEARLAALVARLGLSEAVASELRGLLLSLAGPPTLPADSGLLGGTSILEPLTASGWSPIATEALGPLRGPARYVLQEQIGAGGMGEVWRVRDQNLNRTVAMKLMRRDLSGALARFIEEAQVTAQLQHPGIVPVYELGRLPDGRYYFTMPEVRGQTLRDAVRSGTVPLRELIAALLRAAEAVAFAHSRGVIHRDLKPANIMVGRFGEVLVMDWGIARLLGQPPRAAAEEPIVTDRAQSDSQETQLGVVLGTPAYMPPEQAYGWIHRIDARSDVYALGATLYHVLSGRPPYQDAGDKTALQQVLAGPPPPLPASAPRGLASTCRRAMARELRRRYADAGAFVGALRAWLADQAPSAHSRAPRK